MSNTVISKSNASKLIPDAFNFDTTFLDASKALLVIGVSVCSSLSALLILLPLLRLLLLPCPVVLVVVLLLLLLHVALPPPSSSSRNGMPPRQLPPCLSSLPPSGAKAKRMPRRAESGLLSFPTSPIPAPPASLPPPPCGLRDSDEGFMVPYAYVLLFLYVLLCLSPSSSYAATPSECGGGAVRPTPWS